MPSYVAYIFVALVSIFVTTNWFLPLLARYLTRCRLTYLSLSRIKGFEWRHESHASAIVPDIRLEHGSWRYGGWNRPQGVGLFVIYASGLSYRQRDRPRPRQENKAASQKPPSPLAEYLAPVTGMMGGLAKTLVIGVPSLLLHHYPSLGGLLSFQISDGRVIFDELDGLELTWSVLKLGAKVSFSKKDEAGLEQDGKETIGRSSISSTAADDIDPSWPASPPDSPVVDRHRPFVFPSASELNVNADAVPRPSRLSHARRRASAMSSRMTSTASQVWGRVIGRAKGHVKLTIEFSDLAIILPHSNPTHPLSRPSIPDLVPQPHPQCDSNGLSHSLSTKSLKARTIKNTYSMDRLFRSVPRYALPSHEGGYERLLALEGESKVTGTMRFGTRRGWLAEDTLSLDTELGKLQTSLGAWTKVQTLMDKYKKSKVGPRGSQDEKTKDMGGKKAEDRWSSESKARICVSRYARISTDEKILLRAFQSISISLSQVVISHFLSVSNSNAGSANSSTSDLSSLVSEDYFTLSLDVRALAIKLSAADSSNNLRARNAFGTNNNRTSRVKGVGLTLSWDAIDIESTSPGALYADRHQLLAIRQADLEGFSSWRPHGWTRDELLFVTDPNLALVVSRASIGSIDAAADVQLLNELSEAWAATHPRSAPTASPTQEPVKSAVQLHQGLPPRFRLVLDIGHCKFVLADRISQQKTMLIVETHGIHLGGYTNFADRVGRRKDKMSTRNAFKEEEQLQQRRAEYGDSVDYALPDAMLRPQVRRRFNQENAKLLEDLTMSMSFDGNLEMEPLSVHLSLQQGETGQKETFSLAEIGRMHGVASGDVLGRQILDLIDTARLDPSTLSGFVDFGIESGINVNLWEVPVLDALVALGEAHTGTDASPALPPRSKVDILSRLPSGLSCRFSLGLISVFIGQPDPNPAFERKLIRGIWFQTLAIFEYAYYVNTAQTVRTRHDLIAPTRAKLKLKEDITTQALACYHHHAKTDGRAALCRVTLLETFVTPIFDGRKFDEAGGTKMNFKTWQWPEPPMREEDYTAWEFIKPRKSSSIDSAVRQPRPNVEQSKSQPRPQRQSKKKQPENTQLPAEFNDEPTEVVVKGTEGENEIKEKFFAGWNAFLNEFGLASISSLLGFESSPLSPEEVEADVNDGEGKQTRKKMDAADKEKYGPRPDARKATGTEAPSTPAPTANEAATKKAQELRDGKVDEDKVEDGAFSNAIPVFDEAGTNRARRPIFRMESADINWTIEKTTPDAEVEHRFTGKSKPIAFVCGMPLIYCAILAVLGIKRVAEAGKRPPSETEGSRKRPLIHVDFSIPSTTIHMAFPLHEHMFVYLGAMRIGLKANRQMRLDLDQTLVHVPSTSPREKGQWHEFGLVKNLTVTKDATDPANPINVDMEAFRIRVPVGYQISNLVLNITASIKGLKLIMENLKSGKFHTKKSPAAEDPKNVPPIVISIKEVSLEAKDSPIEERLNLIWRVGMAEQLVRLDMVETMSRKIEAIEEYEKYVKAGELTAAELLEDGEFSPFHRRDPEVAEGYLNELISEHWLRRIRAAQTEQKRREQLASDRIHLSTRDLKLPISIAPPALSAPLFRASFQDFKLSIKNPGMARDEIIEYMGEVSASPFDKGTEFSLMVPLHLQWDMGSAKVSLRDYPLPLVNIRPCADGRPAWTLDTTFIIAEELHDDDSTMYVPCEIIPAGLGDSDAERFVVEVYKTISPVKTYTRPHIKIHSERTTEFTWGNSMQPAIQDFMKVMETLSHAQIDPSPRIGFWDKFRLILHWVVKIDFEGPVHLHLKGSNDPYLVDGKGAGFALAWEKNTQFRIAVPNEQYETIQITAEQLLIAIPDLAALNDHAALGVEQIIDENHAQTLEHALLDRRYTKPCARFMNGVRVGFGFSLERTCRQHSCKNEGCDSTAESLMHRSCRITDFKRHQDVILRNKQAVQRDEARLDRKVDSYDGFRSDYIHFSVSVTCPLREIDPDHPPDSTSHNSLHLSPKAFAHFNSWWNLFNHVMSLPIRQGRLFPDSPEPSKKFGDSLATIKYRCDLKPVYVSHMYGQKSRELWDQGKTQSLGIKARFGHFRADIHQRKEEKQQSHKKLKRDKVVSHKAFYAADLILEDIEVKGIRAEFHELPSHLARRSSDDSSIPSDHDPHREGPIEYTRASELGPGDKAWFNLYDFIDADKRPFDHDPKIELVNVADCPEVFYSLRKKVRTAPLQEGQTSELGMSKFGDEKSHICYLGESKSVATVQIKITRRRIRELQDKVKKMQLNPSSPKVQVYKQRLQILHDHIKKMESEEKRDIDGNTFELDADLSDQDCRTGETFQNVVHVHCPSIYFTNQSRNLAYQYWYSYRDRKREEYHTSNKSLVTVREDFDKRIRRRAEREKKDSETPSEEVGEADDLLAGLKKALGSRNAPDCFRLPVDNATDHVDLREPSVGLPAECKAQPKFRFLLLKPQVTFRSEADPDAIILLAVEEYSHQTFKVIDTTAKDDVSMTVLHRNYGSLKGLQAFYPNAETLARDRNDSGESRGSRRVPALPLEIFLDVKSEAKDYDRIILKTDAAISQDKFNKLRVQRDLKWPETHDEQGEPIKHLKEHMDLVTLVVPRIALSATSKHYSALYTVITDLLLYQDPDHEERNKLINTFMLQFDRKERDPKSLLGDIENRQREVRYLREIVRGYDQHLDLLTDEGKAELFACRARLFEQTEDLFCVFELLSAGFQTEDAKAAVMNATQTNIRAGSIAWNLLKDDMTSLVKLDIDGTMLSVMKGKDQSLDSACVVSDLSALNNNPDAIFPEVAVRYEPGGLPRGARDPMVSVVWSSGAVVGGIQIVHLLSLDVHPLRLQLEERVGRQIKDYIFNDRVAKRRELAGNATPRNDSSSQKGSSKASSTLELAPLNRSRSAVSVNSNTQSVGGRSVSTSGRTGEFDLVPQGDADEMRRRANNTRTFERLEVSSTTIVVTYKRDDKRRHKTWSMPAAVDLKIKTPRFAYADKIWTIEDAFKQMQRDGISNMLLSTSLIGQVVRKTGVFRSNRSLKSLAKHTSPSARPSGGFLGSPSSRLKFAVESSNEDEQSLSKAPTRDGGLGSPIQRVVSRLSQHGHLSTPSSPSSAERSSSSHLSKSPSTSMMSRSRDRELSEPADSMPSDEAGNSSGEEQHEGGSVGRAVKGLMHKFKHRKDAPEMSSRRGSHDDVNVGRLG